MNTKLDDSVLEHIEEFLNVASDYTRLKILYALINKEEKCVSDIQEIIGASQTLVSHQLAVLKKADFVRSRKDGRHVLYSLSDDHVVELLKLVHDHVIEEGHDHE